MRYCEEYAALLDLFVDGELSPREMERVRAHMESCPGCRRYVDDALAIRAGFGDVEDTAAPEGFAEGVMERIRKEDAKIVELRRRSARRWLGSLAALAACCALVIFLRPGGYGGGADKPVVTSGAAAPESCEVAGSEEDGTTSRMKEVPEAAPSELEQKRTAGQAGPQMTERAGDSVSNDFAMDRAAGPGEARPYVSLESSLPEDVEAEADSGETEPALRLSVEEAGELLDGYEPVWRTAEESCYELSGEEYRALLESLGRPVEAEGESFTVLVTQSPGNQPVQ